MFVDEFCKFQHGALMRRLFFRYTEGWPVDPAKVVKPTVFDASDGVPSSPLPAAFAQRVTKSRDGKLWFVTADGVGSGSNVRAPTFEHRGPGRIAHEVLHAAQWRYERSGHSGNAAEPYSVKWRVRKGRKSR